MFSRLPSLTIFSSVESDTIKDGWEDFFGKSVLEANVELNNPLKHCLRKMTVSYKLGGFFEIRRVKWAECGLMFMDYDILIESVLDKAAFDKLHALHQASKDPEMGSFILREEIMDVLTGVGRILQYFVPTEGKLDKSTPRQLWSMYEGQIKGGIANGFARIIYGETGKSYMGFYKDGQKRGKGIQRKPDGSIQAQGIWSGNETIAKGTETMVIDDF